MGWCYHIAPVVVLLPSIFLTSYTVFFVYLQAEHNIGKRLRGNIFMLTRSPQTEVTIETLTDSPANVHIDSSPRLEFVHITKTGGSAIEKVGAQHGIIWGACHYMNISDVGCYGAHVPYTAPNYQSYALTSPWHSPPKILKQRVNSSLYPYEGAELFTVVRNPYGRAMSEFYCPWIGYKGKDKNDPDVMNKWIGNMTERLEKVLLQYNAKNPKSRPKVQGPHLNEDPWNLAQKHFINQAEYVYDGDKQVIKNIVHYENLSNEFGEVMKKYNLNIVLPGKKYGGVYTNDEDKLTYLHLYPETIAVINKYAAQDFEKFGYEMVEKFDEDADYSLV